MTDENKRTNIAAEVARGDDSLESAEILLGAGKLADSVSRAYYAVFHYGRALLLMLGEEPKTHGGLDRLLQRDRDRDLVVACTARAAHEACGMRRAAPPRRRASRETTRPAASPVREPPEHRELPVEQCLRSDDLVIHDVIPGLRDPQRIPRLRRTPRRDPEEMKPIPSNATRPFAEL